MNNPDNMGNAATSDIVNRDQVVSTLNSLISICKDGEEGYRKAAEVVNSLPLTSLFTKYSEQRGQFATELTNLVDGLGGDPAERGSLAGAVHRGWINLRSAVSGEINAETVLDECERGEDAAKTAYESALAAGLPANIHDKVQRQYEYVRLAHDHVRGLRDAQ
jgi:uncharacterized protein (TIGR02284 family)